ncbi:MAG: nucleoside-diphosphate sugar epimerase/dehydratase [Gammaproteobacteria bacterium]|nr:nucleoside-diphosphate sugar epimerase/dehydratase [Gammaproteobacteria bacterium]
MIGDWFLGLPRHLKQALAALADGIVLPLALWAAIALRLGEWQPEVGNYWPAFLAAALVSVPIFISLGLYRQVIRYIGKGAFRPVIKGTAAGALAVAAVAYMAPLPGFPRSVPVIFGLLATLYVAGSRFALCHWLQWRSARAAEREPVIIYGAGRKGVELARALAEEGRYEPKAFIDDDKTLCERTIDGLTVHSPKALEALVRQTDARQVLVAAGSASSASRANILRFLEPYRLRVRLVPDIEELQLERGRLAEVRDVQIEDLLGRTEIDPLPHLLKASVAGRQVMVTGAGGSIGSELCRQIVRQAPQRLVLLDHSEYELYRVQREVEQICVAERLDVAVAAVLGSVTNRAFIRHSLAHYGVETLYHAAAYKHVGLVEHNAIEGFKNNTFGTLYTAEEALRAGVKDFILISTDKAVRTSSVMGASKRLAEMALQAMQPMAEGTCFSMVRFGNVLKSSGSVVPLFLDQIDKGGPITVTHREVTRYFMTIREAAQLVMQAASMAKGGDVFLLDMGEPIRIVDLATRMAQFKGYAIKSDANPDGDIEIQFTGLGRGEKLHEELLVGEDVSGTDHSKIMRAEEHFVPWPELRPALDALEEACNSYDHQTIRAFAESLVNGSALESQLGGVSGSAPILSLHGRRARASGPRIHAGKR